MRKNGASPKQNGAVPFWRLPAYIAAAVLFSEGLFRLLQFDGLFPEFWLTAAFSLSLAGAVWLLGCLLPRKANTAVTAVFLFVMAVYLCIQHCYYDVFRAYMSLTSLIMGGGDVLKQFYKTVLSTILANIPVILGFLLPGVLFLVFRRWLVPQSRQPLSRCLTAAAVWVLGYVMALTAILTGSTEILSPYDLYYHSDVQELKIGQFGAVTSLRLDVQTLIFGSNSIFDPLPEEEPFFPTLPATAPTTAPATAPETTPTTAPTTAPATAPETAPETAPATVPATTAPVVYGENVMDIDFASLIANAPNKTVADMHKYFSQVPATKKNEYTGMFEGYNVVLLTAESFSYLAVDEELTPTLYKMVNGGFVFNNFYNPLWGVSTSDGEYLPCTGLLPKSGVWSMWRSGSIYMPFVLGNQLGSLGYSARAYHANTYTYYKRHETYPNHGYEYKAHKNGLEVYQSWPQSDLEMVQKTVDEYINDEQFHVYYMTVSGHMDYTFNDNYIAWKNYKLVKDLPYSEAARAYLACNIELDRALEYLIQRFEEAGVLDKTLFVMSADHYPYGLPKSAIEELAGHEVDDTFEIYRSNLIIWNSQMEPIVVDKVCSSLDVLPTVSNLLGLEYDSRLLMGTDILSDSDPLVIFLDRSFITDKVRYASKTKTVTKLTDEELPENYISNMNSIISKKFTYSARILENDYYGHVFNKLQKK